MMKAENLASLASLKPHEGRSYYASYLLADPGGDVVREHLRTVNALREINRELVEALDRAVEWVALFDRYGPGLNGFECDWLADAKAALARGSDGQD